MTKQMIKTTALTILATMAASATVVSVALFHLRKVDAATLNVPTYVLNLQTGLVGWWTFDGSNMTKVVADSSGNGNDGTLTPSSVATSTVPGPFGQAISFNGTSNYVLIPDDASLHAANLTVCAWANFNDVSVNHVIVDKPQNGPTWASPYLSFMVRYNGASSPKKWELDLGNSSGYSGATSVWNDTIPTNEWHFVCMTYNGSVISAYRDGASLGSPVSFTGPINYTSSPVLIGADYGASPAGEYMNGDVDDVRIYNRTLAASEISQLYSLGVSSKMNVTSVGPSNISSGLAGWWSFDGTDINGSSVTDRTGNGSTATLNNFGTVTATTSTWTVTGPGSWKAPSGVTSALAELWAGGGGSGGAISSRGAGGGGGGGAYAAKTVSVTPGTTYSFYVARGGAAGAAGNNAGKTGDDSMFVSSSTVLAKAGTGGGGGATGGSGTAGSAQAGSIGDTIFTGGNGAAGAGGSGSGKGGGAGGGGGGSTANGTAATGIGTAVGTGGSPDGGNGGNGATTQGAAGGAGNKFGGGAGGGYAGTSGSVAGAAGGQGQVRITGYSSGGSVLAGKTGQGILFDGSSAYVSFGAPTASLQTLSFWFKASTSTTQSIADLNGTQTVTISSNTVRANNWTSPTIYVDGALGSTISDKEWHLIVITTGTPVNASAFNMGKVGTTYCGCAIDGVRIYTRALSAFDVSTLHTHYTGNIRSTTVSGPNNLGTATGSSGLVAWYTFDGADMLKNIGNRVSSSFSGNLNGIANNSTSTAPGKFGQAYLFGGTSTNVYINIPSGPSNVQTVSFWVKESTTTSQSFMALNSTATITANAAGTISAGAGWSSPTIYVDGAVSSTIDKDWHLITITTGTPVNANAFTLGKSGSNTCGCTMDDVRLYSRALSPSEVGSLYTMGK